jgi:hypothetical protein
MEDLLYEALARAERQVEMSQVEIRPGLVCKRSYRVGSARQWDVHYNMDTVVSSALTRAMHDTTLLEVMIHIDKYVPHITLTAENLSLPLSEGQTDIPWPSCAYMDICLEVFIASNLVCNQTSHFVSGEASRSTSYNRRRFACFAS